MKAIEQSAESIINAMNRNGIAVDRVTIGEGYNKLIEYLENRYKKQCSELAIHRDYDGYSDADEAQYIIKTYHQVTQECATTIRETIDEAKRDIQETAKATKNQRTTN